MMMAFQRLLLLLLFLTLAESRPPAQNELQDQQNNNDIQFTDYFEDFFPVLLNSTKLHENYQYEKKKYLTMILGLPKRMKKI
ncbi:unnamed protein product [Caenorhabditis bovis]|uniref:Uncharacterized protein n=1 Tax=Caenorhabditis bovis TaxID=2654633 RepID=A0A8S1ECK0_9PELO|nr:unnamed protein product [Caenorhabditis bovis]